MEQWELINPHPGAHIRTKVQDIYHHAIYLGNDEVVQFGLPFDMFRDPTDVRVMKSPIEDFLVGFLEVRVYSKKELKKKRTDQEIIQIALSRVGEGNYNILKNNCEHFCNECVFGEKVSTQVDNLAKQIRAILKNG